MSSPPPSLTDRPWLQHYPPGVPAEIDTSAIPSLAAMLDDSFRRFRDRTAVIFMGKTLSYGAIDDASRALGAFLQSTGMTRGSRVAVMMPNVPQYPVATAAILRAGFVVVNINPLYKARELELQLADSGAEALVVLENFASVAQEALPRTQVKHVIVASIGDMIGLKGMIVNFVVRHIKKMVPAFQIPNATRFKATLSAGRAMTLCDAAVGPDDIAFLQYTGGTTGVAKGATLLHRNLIANVLQIDEWQKPAIDRPPTVEQMIVVTALPLYHSFALTACFLWGTRLGAALLLITNPRDIPGLVKELAQYKVNSFPAVNTLYAGLLNHPDFKRIDWSLLKCAVGGGMAVNRAVADAWFAATGHPIIEGYGLSETSPVLTCNRGDITQWTGTIGLPLPSTEIAIRDDDNNAMPMGERGEICARGPQLMAGYWNRPDETAACMTADGFFRTGDIGIMDAEGRVTIVDRKKDMISVSGLKVFPNEVEDVAMSQGGLLECAAIGIPDAHSGEVVALYAVKKVPELTEAQLRDYLRARLTSYKVPKHIEFRSELPKTNVGKILRRALRDEVMQRMSDTFSMKDSWANAKEIVSFWREAGPERWFKKDAAFDAEIKHRFMPAYEAAAVGKLRDWENSAEGALALLILLDQFPRNMFRGDKRSFATDPLARAVTAGALIKGFDAQAGDMRGFFYLPFQHSEDLADQERGVALYKAAGDADGLKWAELHADIIRKFGRFPHRNAVLGRTTTAEEQAFLDSGGFAG